MVNGIFFNDSRYIPAQKAADMAGCTRDYIAKLARTGRLTGKRIAKAWFIEEKSLGEFILMQRYTHQLRRKRLSEDRVREYKQSVRFPKKISFPEKIILSRPAHSPQARVAKALAKAASAPTGIRAMQRAAQMHTPPVHLVSPALDFVHKLSALFTALLVTFGLYALVDTNFARYAQHSFRTLSTAISEKHTALIHVDLEQSLGEAVEHIAQNTQNIFDGDDGGRISPQNMYAVAAVAMTNIDRTVTERAQNMATVMLTWLFGADGDRGGVKVEIIPVKTAY